MDSIRHELASLIILRSIYVCLYMSIFKMVWHNLLFTCLFHRLFPASLLPDLPPQKNIDSQTLQSQNLAKSKVSGYHVIRTLFIRFRLFAITMHLPSPALPPPKPPLLHENLLPLRKWRAGTGHRTCSRFSSLPNFGIMLCFFLG